MRNIILILLFPFFALGNNDTLKLSMYGCASGTVDASTRALNTLGAAKAFNKIKNVGGERWFTKDSYISEIKFKAYNIKSGTYIYLLNTPGEGFYVTNAELNDNVILVRNMVIGSLGGINRKVTNDPNPDNSRIAFYADSGDEGVIDVYGKAFVKQGSFMYYNNDLDYYSEPTTTVGGASSTAANANAISGGLVSGQSYWWDDGNVIFLMKVK